MSMVKKFEGFLRRLDVLGYETTIIPPDWPDYEEWMWTMYRKRVIESSQGVTHGEETTTN